VRVTYELFVFCAQHDEFVIALEGHLVAVGSDHIHERQLASLVVRFGYGGLDDFDHVNGLVLVIVVVVVAEHLKGAVGG
jgi:hypothetical protein